MKCLKENFMCTEMSCDSSCAHTEEESYEAEIMIDLFEIIPLAKIFLASAARLMVFVLVVRLASLPRSILAAEFWMLAAALKCSLEHRLMALSLHLIFMSTMTLWYCRTQKKTSKTKQK
jgi:hypothetical protein